MQNAGFNFGKNIPINEKAAAHNGQNNATQNEPSQKQTPITNIFSNNNNANLNQMNNNSSGMGNVPNIFTPGAGLLTQPTDNTSIFAGMQKGSSYSLYSNKDYSYDVPKLTQEDIAAQKNSQTPLKTNPKASGAHVITKVNPYEAYKNPEMQETSLKDTLSNAFGNLFGQKKAD